MKNPCVKTGCVGWIGTQYWRGDLFDLGDYYMLNCPSGPEFISPAGLCVNLYADTWQSDHQDEKVVLIHKKDVCWFDYGGPLLDAKGLIQVA